MGQKGLKISILTERKSMDKFGMERIRMERRKEKLHSKYMLTSFFKFKQKHFLKNKIKNVYSLLLIFFIPQINLRSFLFRENKNEMKNVKEEENGKVFMINVARWCQILLFLIIKKKKKKMNPRLQTRG